LPEVIGIGIAGNVFFGWPYWIGVILSLVTTMIFLAMLHFDISKLEFVIFLFVGMMSIALFVEMSFVGVDAGKLFRGWTTDIASATTEDLLSITGILGAVVMPHNLYLHSASCQSRRVIRTEEVVTTVVKYCAWEPVLPIIVSIFVNMAIVSIAAETVYYDKTLSASDAANVGLTDFCEYFRSIRGGCLFWGFALLAAGQSSAVTTTLTGQYIMDGFLKLRLPMWKRAVISRLVAISPCILVSIMFPSGSELNRMVNIVNSSLSLLLPFALTPLVKYNCSTAYMGRYAAGPKERVFMYLLAFSVYFINALSLSTPGGGFFDFVFKMEWGFRKVLWIILQVLLQLFYLCWNLHCILTPVRAPMTPLTQLRPYVEGEFALAPKQAVVAQS
jgi:NRAMP (natural resistance-associated macrophage protein)-like metal ion transporter